MKMSIEEHLKFEDNKLYHYYPLPQYGEGICKKDLVRNPYVCADAIGGNAQDIYRCLRGKTKTHKGFHYKEIKDGNVD